MIIERREFQHPYQASEVSLVVYQTAADSSHVEGLPDDAGFLVTEEWAGAGKVVKTLGFYRGREEALSRAAERARQLEAQRYRPVAPAA
jgi:hypothetical protein